MAPQNIASSHARPALPGAIDVHQHYLPPFYLERALASMERIHAATPIVKGWSPERAVEAMDEVGIARAVLSISTPGFEFGGEWDLPADEIAAMARKANEFARRMMDDYPRRFAMFTVLPLPDVAASLEEIRHGFDELAAAGVGLLSNYGGRHLGDPLFRPVLEELNHRRAIVYVHPTDLPCCRGLVPGVPDTSIEYPADTARTVASLIWSEAFVRFPDIRFIFAHGCGVYPMIMSRLLRAYAAHLGRTKPEEAAALHAGSVKGLSRLFVDTAGIANPAALAATRAWVHPDQILYGSDHPFVNASTTMEYFLSSDLDEKTLDHILSLNAAKLFNI